MNVLRHNLVTLFLTVAVVAVTALNSYTTKTALAEFHMNNADLVLEVALTEARRCDRMEAALGKVFQDRLEARRVVNELQEQLSIAAHHIRDCHILMEKAKVQPPSFPLETCPPGCPLCPQKLREREA